MELKSELKYPYTEDEHADFIVAQNHEKGYEIREVETTYTEEIEVPYTETVEEVVNVPVLDEEGDPILDEDGNPLYEEKTETKEVEKTRVETVERVVFDVQAWGLTEEEIKEAERARISNLSMTKREMFLGLYQAKGITPDMLKAQISAPSALIEFEYANDYYRGNPLIDEIGTQLGFTVEQMDKFFETKDFRELVTEEQ